MNNIVIRTSLQYGAKYLNNTRILPQGLIPTTTSSYHLECMKRQFGSKAKEQTNEEKGKNLTDTFGRHHTYLRISLTERCNLRSTASHGIYMASPYTLSQVLQYRSFCSSQNSFPPKLTHVDNEGKAKMIDVSHKPTTERLAVAQASVYVGEHIANLIATNSMQKGDVLTIAEVSGIIGAKYTSQLIPLCHNIPLNSIKVKAKLDAKEQCVLITTEVLCSGKTGVEMEALTSAAVAALAIYDMCKAVSHNIIIRDIRLCTKTGGKRDFNCEKSK